MIEAARHSWWIPVATTAVAVAVAFASLGGASAKTTTHEGRVTITVDVSTISKYPGMPSPEELLVAVGEDEFRARAAAESSVPAGDLVTQLRVYTLGTKQERMIVAYRSDDPSVAAEGVVPLADAVRKEAQRLGAAELALHRELAASSTNALKALARAERARGGEPDVSSVGWRWQMRTVLEQESAIVRDLEGAYRVHAATVALVDTPSKETSERLAAAILLGLAAGIALAALREARAHRRAAA